jgi:hypothetical protein
MVEKEMGVSQANNADFALLFMMLCWAAVMSWVLKFPVMKENSNFVLWLMMMISSSTILGGPGFPHNSSPSLTIPSS